MQQTDAPKFWRNLKFSKKCQQEDQDLHNCTLHLLNAINQLECNSVCLWHLLLKATDGFLQGSLQCSDGLYVSHFKGPAVGETTTWERFGLSDGGWKLASEPSSVSCL
jgi:hypothetical protein